MESRRKGRAFCGLLFAIGRVVYSSPEISKRMEAKSMLTYTYVSEGKFELMEKPKPVPQHERDAIVKVTLASICSSDLHIKHGKASLGRCPASRSARRWWASWKKWAVQ